MFEPHPMNANCVIRIKYLLVTHFMLESMKMALFFFRCVSKFTYCIGNTLVSVLDKDPVSTVYPCASAPQLQYPVNIERQCALANISFSDECVGRIIQEISSQNKRVNYNQLIRLSEVVKCLVLQN